MKILDSRIKIENLRSSIRTLLNETNMNILIYSPILTAFFLFISVVYFIDLIFGVKITDDSFSLLLANACFFSSFSGIFQIFRRESVNIMGHAPTGFGAVIYGASTVLLMWVGGGLLFWLTRPIFLVLWVLIFVIVFYLLFWDGG